MKATADVFDILKFDLNMSSFGLVCAGRVNECKQRECRLVKTFDWFDIHVTVHRRHYVR
jgi:hypothetical protein